VCSSARMVRGVCIRFPLLGTARHLLRRS
jgi:hypothetical protein